MTRKKVKRPYMDLHFLVEVYNVDKDKLTDMKQIEERCIRACQYDDVEILSVTTDEFGFCGVTCTVDLRETRLTCTTWPEKQLCEIDIITCGTNNPREAAFSLLDYFDSDDYTMNDYAR